MYFALFSIFLNRGAAMGGLSFRENRRKKKINVDVIREVVLWIFQIAVVLAIATLLVVFLGKKVTIIGNSMNPTMESGDEVLLNKLAYTLSVPKRGDLVVFKPNGNENSHYYVKRVVGIPGDTVQIVNGQLIVKDSDGQTVKVEGIQLEAPIEYAGLAEEVLEIPQDEYFVLGDSPNLSEDSRFADIGNVKKEYIEGTAWFRWKPEFGFIK